MDKIYIVMDYVEHDLKSLMETMKQPFTIGKFKDIMGGGGGSLRLEAVPDARVSSSKKHPKQWFDGRPKDTLNRSLGPNSTS